MIEKTRKAAIVINGAGGVGKDTLCELCAKHIGVMNVSSITPIKDIARLCGWGGEKDDKARKFLSDLKRLTVEYNDYPTAWIMEKYREFLRSDSEVMFIHIREPEEIAKFVKATGGAAKTLLVRGGERMKKTVYGNVSDDLVEEYSYDFYFMNDASLDEAEISFTKLIKSIIAE